MTERLCTEIEKKNKLIIQSIFNPWIIQFICRVWVEAESDIMKTGQIKLSDSMVSWPDTTRNDCQLLVFGFEQVT